MKKKPRKVAAALAIALLASFVSSSVAESLEYNSVTLEAESLLGRVAKVFKVSAEYPTIKLRNAPKAEDELSREDRDRKEKMIQAYLQHMRTGHFGEAEGMVGELGRYREYLSVNDFNEVAAETPKRLGDDDTSFVLFPSFYKKVYSAVVHTLGSKYEHFEWPLALFDVKQGQSTYHFVAIAAPSGNDIVLLDPEGHPRDVISYEFNAGPLARPFSVTPYYEFAEGNLFSVNVVGNCLCSVLYRVHDSRIAEVNVVARESDGLVYERSGQPWFCVDCGTIGGGRSCSFVLAVDGPERLSCSGWDRELDDSVRKWTAVFDWIPEQAAFVEVQYESKLER